MAKQAELDKFLALETASRTAAAEATTRALKHELSALHKMHGASLEFNDSLLAAISAMPPVKPPKPIVPPAGVVTQYNICLGDWHIGEVIKSTELEGHNEYNLAIATQRLALLGDKIGADVAGFRKRYKITHCNIIGLGDFIQGEIQEEYLSTNEFPVPVATVHAGQLLADLLARVLGMFETVSADMIGADNHGRRTRKPPSKEAARNNFNYLIYEIAQGRLGNQPRLAFRAHLPIKTLIHLNSHSILIEHGHTSRGWMGIPHYGITRAEDQEAHKRMRRDESFDLHVMGHWHTPDVLAGRRVMNGCLCGMDEYDVLCGRMTDPGQMTFLLHREHGLHHPNFWNLGEPKGPRGAKR